MDWMRSACSGRVLSKRAKIVRYAPDGTFLDEWGDKQQLGTPASVIVAPDGSTRPRADYGDVVMTVRSFYLDIRDWALHDASLAPWVVASPITRADVAGNAKRKLLNQARIHQRIRERGTHDDGGRLVVG